MQDSWKFLRVNRYTSKIIRKRDFINLRTVRFYDKRYKPKILKAKRVLEREMKSTTSGSLKIKLEKRRLQKTRLPKK